MKIKKLISNELEKTIYLCVWTFKEIQSFSKITMNDELNKEEYWSVRWLCITNKSNVMCCVLTDNCTKQEYRPVLIHEILHWVHYILDYVWQPMDYDSSTEMLAYYGSYYVEKWIEFLSWLKKLAWKRKKGLQTKIEKK